MPDVAEVVPMVAVADEKAVAVAEMLAVEIVVVVAMVEMAVDVVKTADAV